jgi:hypothetical protein
MKAYFEAAVPWLILLPFASLLPTCSETQKPAPPPFLDETSSGNSAADDVPTAPPRPILECERDSDCLPQNLEPFNASIDLVSSRCTHISAQTLPICECEIRGTYQDPTTGETQTVAGPLAPGNREGGCSEFARTPDDCLYCASEFPGCDIAEAGSCDAISAWPPRAASARLQLVGRGAGHSPAGPTPLCSVRAAREGRLHSISRLSAGPRLQQWALRPLRALLHPSQRWQDRDLWRRGSLR